jgi:hypothetical protein
MLNPAAFAATNIASKSLRVFASVTLVLEKAKPATVDGHPVVAAEG